MSSPNVEGTSNPTATGGSDMGIVVGKSPLQTLGFFGSAGTVRYATTGNVTGFAAGSGTASKSDSVWTGGVGSTAYTVGDVVAALKNAGFLPS